MRYLVLVFVLFVFIPAWAQAPFEKEIRNFKKQDSIQAPPQKAILFVGSSSFRLWKNLEQDFPQKKIINRGFGGSTFADVLYYYDDVISPYRPKQVIVYCGENDLANKISPDAVLEQFKKLFFLIRKSGLQIDIVFVSIKPSPSRKHLMNEIKTTNDLIRKFLSTKKSTHYVDVFTLMLDENGDPRKELFVEDNLHMNRAGYEIWKKAISPFLK
jgi:lysophospholipase L1-like esterase